MPIYSFSDKDIQLILEYKNNFGKYHPVFRKIPFKFFGGHPVCILSSILLNKPMSRKDKENKIRKDRFQICD